MASSKLGAPGISPTMFASASRLNKLLLPLQGRSITGTWYWTRTSIIHLVRMSPNLSDQPGVYINLSQYESSSNIPYQCILAQFPE